MKVTPQRSTNWKTPLVQIEKTIENRAVQSLECSRMTWKTQKEENPSMFLTAANKIPIDLLF